MLVVIKLRIKFLLVSPQKGYSNYDQYTTLQILNPFDNSVSGDYSLCDIKYVIKSCNDFQQFHLTLFK